MLSRYKSWLLISLVVFSIILIALKTVHIYRSQTFYNTSQRATKKTVTSSDIDSLIVANPSHYSEQIRQIERQKAELQALDASIDNKIQALKEAEHDVLELLESADIDDE